MRPELPRHRRPTDQGDGPFGCTRARFLSQGVWSSTVDDPFAQAVADVTAADLQRALERHLARFLIPVDATLG